MTRYELTVAGKSARFYQLDGETFDEALCRGAASLGYHGGAFAQPNLATNHQVTVTDKPSTPSISNARRAYNGTVRELMTPAQQSAMLRSWGVVDPRPKNRFTGERPAGRPKAAQRC